MNSYYSKIYTDGTYLKNNPFWDQQDAKYKSSFILRLLSNRPVLTESIIEVGCGSGQILVELRKNLPTSTQLHGIDISPQAIELAKNNVTPDIKIELRDITKSKLSSKYDLALVIDVIEHLEDYFEFIRELRGISRYTIFHIPLDMCIWSLFREQMLIESKNRVGHIHNFTENFIKSILVDHEYEIIETIFTEPQIKTQNIKQRIVELVRKILFRINPRFCSKTIGGMSLMLLVKNPE
jgi:SAM-dependent methyltransferase